MRCPRCNLEFNSRSERCPNCGTSAKLARPDGDTMTRVRRQIATVRGEKIEQTEDLLYTSFSPVMRFDKPVPREKELTKEDNLEENPADNFENPEFRPVNISEFLGSVQNDEEIDSEDAAERRHQVISAKIRYMVSNKQDDLLADYYFDDGISDLERYQLEQSFKAQEKEIVNAVSVNVDVETDEREKSDSGEISSDDAEQAEPMSDAAKRLNEFPEEKGADKLLTHLGEKLDAAVLKTKSFFNDLIHNKIARLYNKLDEKTAPFLNKILDKVYYIRFKGLKRKIEDNDAEKNKIRKIIWAVCGVLMILLMCLMIFVVSLFTDSINGQWVVSYDSSGQPNIITEFTVGGKAVVSVKSEDGWHVHKQGTYKTQRKNGHDLLIIEYEDGTTARLYYTIDGRDGTFRNVETNDETVYTLK